MNINEVRTVIFAMMALCVMFSLLGVLYAFLYRGFPAVMRRITPVFTASGVVSAVLGILFSLTFIWEMM